MAIASYSSVTYTQDSPDQLDSPLDRTYVTKSSTFDEWRQFSNLIADDLTDLSTAVNTLNGIDTASLTFTNKTLTSPTVNTPTITGNTTFSDGSYDFNIASHDGSNGLKLAGTLVSSSAAELNILDGVTATATELNLIDGVTSTTAELNILDGVTSTAAELNYNDTGASVGTVVASKTVTVDANKDVSSFRNITLTGELDAGSLDISGNADIDGITNLDVVDIDGAVDMASTLVVGGTFSSNISGDATYFPGYHQNTYGAQLEVAGTSTNGNTLYIGRKDQTALTLGTSVTTSSTDKVANFYDTDQDVGGSPDVGAEVGSITISASSTAFNTSSDYRLKENLVGISDGITRVKQLSPKRFNFKVDSGTTVDGFIAHEVSGIVPEAINGVKDATDDNGNPSYQAIDQSKLIPLLTAALQEAISKIEALETRVAALES